MADPERTEPWWPMGSDSGKGGPSSLGRWALGPSAPSVGSRAILGWPGLLGSGRHEPWAVGVFSPSGGGGGQLRVTNGKGFLPSTW